MLWFILYLLSISVVYVMLVFCDVHYFGRVFVSTKGDYSGPWILIGFSVFWVGVAIVLLAVAVFFLLSHIDIHCPATYLYEKTVKYVEKYWPKCVKEELVNSVNFPPTPEDKK